MLTKPDERVAGRIWFCACRANNMAVTSSHELQLTRSLEYGFDIWIVVMLDLLRTLHELTVTSIGLIYDWPSARMRMLRLEKSICAT